VILIQKIAATTVELPHELRNSQDSKTESFSNSYSASAKIMTIEPEAFRIFEHAGWEAIPEQYHQAFGGLTTQTIGPLLDALQVKSGTKFLDIATGPGYVAAAAARRGATVLGIDFSSRMLEQARQLHPGTEFRQGDAEQLPLGNGLFDSAATNFGILHFAQPELTLREALRVIRAGGYFAFTAWARPEDTIGFDIVLRAVEAYGEPRIQLPEGPPFFRFSDPGECVRELIGAGFENPTVVKVPQLWRLPGGEALFEVMRDSTVRTAGLLQSQKPMVLQKIRTAICADVEQYRSGEVIELPMPALIAAGTKPK
jgi:SAM-dependent methyltransferase